MSWPQVVWIVLAATSVLSAIEKHGKPATGKHDAWSTTIAVSLVAWVLYMGGFFGGCSA